jgi:hypothetical protein
MLTPTSKVSGYISSQIKLISTSLQGFKFMAYNSEVFRTNPNFPLRNDPLFDLNSPFRVWICNEKPDNILSSVKD